MSQTDMKALKRKTLVKSFLKDSSFKELKKRIEEDDIKQKTWVSKIFNFFLTIIKFLLALTSGFFREVYFLFSILFQKRY